ncbi:MAG: penicillin acylase family protein [Acidobacteria bacterium]|nr:penicillin acylase family protein [Acidobacteriota bacterium]MBI3425122.1 penicillin acylase family protein [Acidobacteriota bacterium]
MKPLTILFLVVFTCQLVITAPPASKAQQADLQQRARAALAQTSGTLKLAGLQKPVRVLRDDWGIAHIYAETQDDLFFAQGFSAAQDRLWQLDLWRRTGEGKLAEILGEGALERDKFARLLRYRGDMKAEWAAYAPDAKPIIESFVRGVNAWIEQTKDNLPIEFQLAGYKPEPWTPEVCLTRMAGYVMTRNAATEITRAQLAREFGAAFVDEWMPAEPARKLEIPTGLDLAGIDNKILSIAAGANIPVSFGQTAPNPNDGSNNWVIDGTMSATGKPLLANDPHRQIALPSLRYMVHLVAPGWNVIGSGEPALPGVAAGHNESVGFGFTIVGIDQQDLYVEEINPANPNEYKQRGKWQPMRVEREQINVKGKAEPVTVELKFTAHGPVVYEDAARQRAYALKWVGSEPGTAGYLASLTLNRVQNWNEFLKGLERWKVPSENLVYADVDGNIGWVAAGMTPVRKGPSGQTWSGLLPVPGDGRFEWQGFLPVKDLPQAYNPVKHYVATANHNILPPGYKRELGYEWSNPIRFERIDEVLRGSQRKFSVADFEQLQHDAVSLPARALIAILKEAKFEDAAILPYVQLLTSWDAVLSKDSAAAALFEFWVPKLPAQVFKNHVPLKAWPLVAARIGLLRTLETLKAAEPRWFAPGKSAKEARAARDLALYWSLKEAVAEAQSKLGADPKQWRWGKLHVAPFTHALAANDETRALFNLPAVERDGDANTVFATGGPNFHQNSGASFREILDVSNWDNSVATNVPGQSGQPGSAHYGDLLPLWARGDYFPLLYSKAKVEAQAKQRLTLEPAR